MAKVCAETADGALLHHSYPTLADYIDHMNRYSSLGAEMAVAKGQRGFSVFNIVVRPLATFTYNYFFRLGFLDGREGLLLHLYHAIYVSWKYAKAWELSRQNKSILKRRDMPRVRRHLRTQRDAHNVILHFHRPLRKFRLHISLHVADRRNSIPSRQPARVIEQDHVAIRMAQNHLQFCRQAAADRPACPPSRSSRRRARTAPGLSVTSALRA